MTTCRTCIMDTELTSDLVLDEDGICNFCKMTDKLRRDNPVGPEGLRKLRKLARKIKKKQKNQKYDVIIGISGGCDSSFLLSLAVESLKLRVLAFHFDNGWNTELAEENMRTMLKALKVDNIRVKLPDDIFNEVSKTFLLASTPDCDITNDIAAHTLIYMFAEQYKIKYIFDGHNYRNEGTCPLSWTYMDAKYIASVYKNHTGDNLPVEYPNLWMQLWLKWIIINRIKRLRPLYNIGWTKEKTKEFLTKTYGWKWYGGHHMENKYTAFCAAVMFPEKFKTDRRYIEYSALIRSNEMTKRQALELIKKPIPLSYFREILDGLDIRMKDFIKIIEAPPRSHNVFDSYEKTFRKYRWFFWILAKFNLVPMTFYLKYCKR